MTDPEAMGPQPDPESHVPQRRTFNAAKHCGGKSRNGRPCTNGKGAGTTHLGYGRCKHHGGSTDKGGIHAERERAEVSLAAELTRWGVTEEVDPVEWFQSAINYWAWRATTLGRKVHAMPTEGWTESPLRELFDDAMRTSAALCATAVKQGLAQQVVDRIVVDAQSRVSFIFAILDRVGVDEAMRETFEAACLAVLAEAAEVTS